MLSSTSPIGPRRIAPQNAQEAAHDAHNLEWVLRQPVVDYLAYYTLYTRPNGRRAIALVVLSASGTIIARRVTACKIKETQRLRNWLEALVWFDLPLDENPAWIRDIDEEELWREADRRQLDELEEVEG